MPRRWTGATSFMRMSLEWCSVVRIQAEAVWQALISAKDDCAWRHASRGGVWGGVSTPRVTRSAVTRIEMPQLDSANGNEHAFQFDYLVMAKLHRMEWLFHRLTESKQSIYIHAGELTESFFNAIWAVYRHLFQHAIENSSLRTSALQYGALRHPTKYQL